MGEVTTNTRLRSQNKTDNGTKQQKCDWSGIRTHASEETSALNWRLRPLGHPTGWYVAGARCVPFHRRAL